MVDYGNLLGTVTLFLSDCKAMTTTTLCTCLPVRAVPFKKLWVGMSYINFFDHPHLQFQFFARYPPTESLIS